jgi:hypothetical protein
VARDPGRRQSLPLIVVGILLLACTVSGLATGVGVHRLVNSTGFGGTGPGGPGNRATSSVSPDTTPAASASAGGSLSTVTASPQSTGFGLSAQVSPEAVTVGQQFIVTATVTVYHSSTPLGGVRCTLVPPATVQRGGPSLFAHWPAPVVSDSQGMAVWVLKAPNVSAGSYQLVVLATGTHEYYVYAAVPLTIT